MISAQLRSNFSNLCACKSAASFLGESRVPLLRPLILFSTVAAPGVSELPPSKNPGNTGSLASLLKKNGVSDTQLERMLKHRPQLRFANVEKSVKPKIDVLQEFGYSESEIVEIITRQPGLVCTASESLRRLLSLLHNLFGSNEQVFKVLRKTGWIFTTHMEKTLHPNIEFLKKCGVPTEVMNKILSSNTRVLLYSHEMFRQRVEKLERLGVNTSSTMFIYCLQAVTSLSNEVWDLKLETLKSLGFKESEALIIFRKAPLVFTISSDKIKRVVEVALASKRYNRASIIANPACFGYSIEGRWKPRLEVLKILEERKLIKKWPGLSAIFLKDEKFHELFVAPHPEVFKRVTSTTKRRKKTVA